LVGVYKKEEAHLLLKAFQIKGPADIFVSKFENDNWGLAGYVSSGLERGGFTFQGDIHGKDFGKFKLERQDPLKSDQDSSNHYHGTSSGSVAAAILVPFFALILSGFAFYLYKHRYRGNPEGMQTPCAESAGPGNTHPLTAACTHVYRAPQPSLQHYESSHGKV